MFTLSAWLSVSLEYWIAVVAFIGTVIATKVGGWRLGLPFFILTCFLIGMTWGEERAREKIQDETKEIQDKREEAYREIDKRGTTASDVTKRLQDGSF